ncbi:NAD(P)-dependent oxidoreductase [Streptomyces alanosinicus]|uniref:6-phosphogluconate dehydrogenase n=1 Tax=Streptomyces alanosinicus TaxID=68171 RepID=A0A918YQJ8_9ACTN|nr:NAD(P)-dependent oxidoreductase [Streptomyces alanosinicus]GHE11377.1 6-phosphogluconate dehydrogenase [Streptomyces alanosinicus]
MDCEAITVGLLHPGSMGAAFGAHLRRQNVRVLWCTDGRSSQSLARAEDAGLEGVQNLMQLVARADVLLSLCPPAAAVEVAQQVAACGFDGRLYIEANAITPRRVREVAELLPGAVVIDGAVVGSPPVGGKQPTLYLSGDRDGCLRATALFDASDVKTHVLGTEVGTASALKLSYSSYQKASRILAALAYGVADANGVADELLKIAGKRGGSYLTETDYIPKTASRAWRWAPELDDAAALLRDVGLPDDLMRAASRVLHQWSDARDRDLTVAETLSLLQVDHGRDKNAEP